MLLAALFSVPIWLTVPTYFVIGILWAVLHLPRAVTLQARRYQAWKLEQTSGRPLAETLEGISAKNSPKQGFSWATRILKKPVAGDSKPSLEYSDYRWVAQMLKNHGQADFSEGKILKGFIADIAFWPLRFLAFVVVDGLQLVFQKLAKYLGKLWDLVIVPLWRWFWRVLGRVCRELWHCVRHLFRWLRNALRHVWNQYLAPAYRWLYLHIVAVYQSIISRANREAIADMEVLNGTQKEKI